MPRPMTHTTLTIKPFFGLLAALIAVLALSAGVPASAQAGCSHSGDPVRNISKKNARSAINCLFNKERSSQNVKSNGDLREASQRHSSVMAAQNCYSHQCSGEGDLRARVARTGYLNGSSNWEIGEIIIIGGDKNSARQIVGAWMNSSGHRANIMKSSYEHVGIGISFRRGLVYASGDFGRR